MTALYKVLMDRQNNGTHFCPAPLFRSQKPSERYGLPYLFGGVTFLLKNNEKRCIL